MPINAPTLRGEVDTPSARNAVPLFAMPGQEDVTSLALARENGEDCSGNRWSARDW